MQPSLFYSESILSSVSGRSIWFLVSLISITDGENILRVFLAVLLCENLSDNSNPSIQTSYTQRLYVDRISNKSYWKSTEPFEKLMPPFCTQIFLVASKLFDDATDFQLSQISFYVLSKVKYTQNHRLVVHYTYLVLETRKDFELEIID